MVHSNSNSTQIPAPRNVSGTSPVGSALNTGLIKAKLFCKCEIKPGLKDFFLQPLIHPSHRKSVREKIFCLFSLF